MGLFKKKVSVKYSYDKENQKSIIKASICTGEQVAGFKNIHTGKVEEGKHEYTNFRNQEVQCYKESRAFFQGTWH